MRMEWHDGTCQMKGMSRKLICLLRPRGFCGFTDEELDFIINYDIKYRMGADGEEGRGFRAP